MAIIKRPTSTGMSYQVKVRDGSGNWYPTPTFTNLVEAKKEEARLMELRQKGAKAIGSEGKRITLNEYWEVWSVENRTEVSKSWQISQDQMFRDYVAPVIGDLRMGEIGTPEVGSVLNKIKAKGRSAQTVKHVYSLLRKMFGDAVEYYEMISANPVKARFHRPKVANRKRDFLAPEQAWHLLEATKDHFLGPAIWLQILGALRVSEVQGLRWKSVNFENGTILVCAAYNAKTKQLQDYPKPEDWDYTILPPMLAQYLSSRRGGPEDFVAPGPKGGMLSYSTYLPALKRLCRKAGLIELETHELRHTATEIYVQAGASAEDVRRLLNQKSLNATKHYIHRTDTRLTALAGNIRPGLKLVGNTNVPNSVPNREQKDVSVK